MLSAASASGRLDSEAREEVGDFSHARALTPLPSQQRDSRRQRLSRGMLDPVKRLMRDICTHFA